MKDVAVATVAGCCYLACALASHTPGILSVKQLAGASIPILSDSSIGAQWVGRLPSGCFATLTQMLVRLDVELHITLFLSLPRKHRAVAAHKPSVLPR